MVDVPAAKFSREQKLRIRTARVRAALSVNRELILLYKNFQVASNGDIIESGWHR